jgi:acyl-CoA ligase (AMP-forming) (exosortase A-associated)
MILLFHDLLTKSSNRCPEKTCLVYRGTSFTYRQIEGYVRKMAHILQKAGLRPGDRVATYLEKSIEESVSFLAISMAGGIFVDINTLFKARQVNHILADSGCRTLITSHQRLQTIGKDLSNLSQLTTVIATGRPSQTAVSLSTNVQLIDLQSVIEKADPTPCPNRRIDADPAAIIYTSGSTGMPKGVVVSHRNLVAGAQSIASYLHNTEQDRILSILPFSFDYGLNQLATSLLVGATLVLQNYLGPADILRALQRECITGLAGIPTIWSQLLQLEWSGEQLPHLRYITNSGGRFPEHQVKEYRRRLPETAIYLMYGLTEAFRSTYLEPDQVDLRPTSIGKAIPNAEILVLNEQGEPCAPGEIGELVHRGVHVALGYWRNPGQTRERFRPNPLQPRDIQTEELVAFSGDFVEMDEEGYLYFVGRKDNMIKTSGFRVSPTEVEEYFYSTGKVQDAVAVGIPHEELGEYIKVIFSSNKGESIEPNQLLSLVSRDMPSYMVPKEIEIRESLPKNSNGKIDRDAVQQQELTRRLAI